jgi:hypothetical protein
MLRVLGNRATSLDLKSNPWVFGLLMLFRHHSFLPYFLKVKSSRRDTTTTVTFKGETGCMNAIISCRDHDHSKRDIYDLCETNEGGEVRI